MQVKREKEKIYIIAKDESEAKKTELLINPLLIRLSLENEKTNKGESDWESFKQITKGFREVQQSEIEALSEEVKEAMWQDYKKRIAL